MTSADKNKGSEPHQSKDHRSCDQGNNCFMVTYELRLSRAAGPLVSPPCGPPSLDRTEPACSCVPGESPLPLDCVPGESPLPLDCVPGESPLPLDCVPGESPLPLDCVPGESPLPLDCVPGESPLPLDCVHCPSVLQQAPQSLTDRTSFLAAEQELDPNRDSDGGEVSLRSPLSLVKGLVLVLVLGWVRGRGQDMPTKVLTKGFESKFDLVPKRRVRFGSVRFSPGVRAVPVDRVSVGTEALVGGCGAEREQEAEQQQRRGPPAGLHDARSFQRLRNFNPLRQRPQSFWVPLGLLSKQNPTEPTRTAEKKENAGPKSGPGQPLFSVTGSVPKAGGVTRGRSFEPRMVAVQSDVTESPM
ncbi:hypothetical protein D4764_07G0010880 [Takifugu flavidus]|uniref:Uncharacterized protein n=1 Tax=Takifugu flavidus TaxID=433684 RepID=A0A5C6MUB1_9TELE|nr:hypothetical protein D4764_07G0010880 [Takifugu flavidus]